MKTPKKQREKMDVYMKTYKGTTARMHNHMKHRNLDREREAPDFTLAEFRDWFIEKEGMKIFDKWVTSGYNRHMRPSIDRLDPLKGYVFSNMQIITYAQNIRKANIELKILIGKRTKQMLEDGTVIGIYPSQGAAARASGVEPGEITRACKKQSHYCNGYFWDYVNKDDLIIVGKTIKDLLEQIEKLKSHGMST